MSVAVGMMGNRSKLSGRIERKEDYHTLSFTEFRDTWVFDIKFVSPEF